MFRKLLFWRKPPVVTGMTIPVIIPAGGAKVSVSFTSDKQLDVMVVKADDELIGYRQVNKKPPKAPKSNVGGGNGKS